MLRRLAHVFGQGAAQADVAVEAFLQQFVGDDLWRLARVYYGPGAVGVVHVAVGVDDGVDGFVALTKDITCSCDSENLFVGDDDIYWNVVVGCWKVVDERV